VHLGKNCWNFIFNARVVIEDARTLSPGPSPSFLATSVKIYILNIRQNVYPVVCRPKISLCVCFWGKWKTLWVAFVTKKTQETRREMEWFGMVLLYRWMDGLDGRLTCWWIFILKTRLDRIGIIYPMEWLPHPCFSLPFVGLPQMQIYFAYHIYNSNLLEFHSRYFSPSSWIYWPLVLFFFAIFFAHFSG